MTERELFMAIVDGDILVPCDAIVLLQGDGLFRVAKAIELFKNKIAPIIVYSGASDSYDNSCASFQLVLQYLEQNGVPTQAVIYEDKSQNTHEQAVEVINLCKTYGWNSISIITSPYHQYRAYLTFLQEVKKQALNLLLFNAPSKNLAWFSKTNWGKRIDIIKIEFEKISEYTQYGHLASYKDAIEYQKIKESQCRSEIK